MIQPSNTPGNGHPELLSGRSTRLLTGMYEIADTETRRAIVRIVARRNPRLAVQTEAASITRTRHYRRKTQTSQPVIQKTVEDPEGLGRLRGGIGDEWMHPGEHHHILTGEALNEALQIAEMEKYYRLLSELGFE